MLKKFKLVYPIYGIEIGTEFNEFPYYSFLAADEERLTGIPHITVTHEFGKFTIPKGYLKEI